MGRDKMCWNCGFNKWGGLVYECTLKEKPTDHGLCNKWAGTYIRTTEEGELIQRARLKLLGIGKFAFETKLFDDDFELNINMPNFDSIDDAVKWIESVGKWRPE